MQLVAPEFDTGEDYRALLGRHRHLAKGVAVGEATGSEKRELRLIRWEIDRIEDARESADKALLDAMVVSQKELAREISGIVKELTEIGVVPDKKKHSLWGGLKMQEKL